MSVKTQFPFFKKHPKVVYLDSASTSQRLGVSLKAEESYYLDFNANVHRGLYPLAEKATEKYEAVRETARQFLNAKSSSEIVFTRGATESLNIVAQGWGRKFLKQGDEIVLSVLEHHSNLVPWQMVAKETGAVLRFCPILSTGNLDYKALAKLITKKTKIVTMTGLSNTLGTVIDLSVVLRFARKVGAKVCVDAAQLAAHFPIDVQKLDVDFLAFSGHKIYGPTGAGILYAKREILEEMDPWLGGGDMIREVHEEFSTWNETPWKFEAGTPNIAQIIGMGPAMKFLMKLGKNTVMRHDREMQEYMFKKLNELPFVKTYGPKSFDQHRACISFTVDGVHPHDVSTVRVSFGIYNTKEDVEALARGLKKVAKVFKLV